MFGFKKALPVNPTEEPPQNMRLVGGMDVPFTKEGSRNKFKYSILFWMNEKDERNIYLITDEPDYVKSWMKQHAEWIDAMVWAEGGPFPKDFTYFEDPLKDMLMRMVDDKVRGE